MKIKNKKLLTLCLALGTAISLLPIKNSFAYESKIKIVSGAELNYIKNGGLMHHKHDSYSQRPVYCFQHDYYAHAGEVSYSREYNGHNKDIIKYILEIGYNKIGVNPSAIQFFKKPNGSVYSTSNEKYYVTQQAIFIALGQKTISKYQNNINKPTNANNAHYGNNAIALYQYAAANAKNLSKTASSSKSVSLNVSPKNLSFTKSDDQYVSTWHTISSSGANSVTQYVVDGPYNTTIEKNGNSFRVRVPVSSVGNATHNVSIKVEAIGTTSGTSGTPGTVSIYDKGGKLQPMAVYDKGTSGAPGQQTSASVLVTGTVGECDTTPLPDNWIQEKRLFLNGRYNIKQGNNNVGTFKIGKNYVLNPVVQYNYSSYWGGDLTKSKSEDSRILSQNKINSKYENILSKYTTKETSSNTNKEKTTNITEASNSNAKEKISVNSTKNTNEVEGCAIDSREVSTCPPRPRPERPEAGSISGTIKYTIKYVHLDGTVKATQTGTANTGTLKIPGNPASASTSKFSDTPININVPNIEKLVEAQIELILNDSKLNIRVPIEVEFNGNVWIDKISTSADNCTTNYIGEEIAIKGDIKSNIIKTKNYNTKLIVTFNGGKTQTFEKMVYGVSEVTPGNVFYKFKIPTVIPGTNTKVNSVQFKIVVEGSSKSSKVLKVIEMDEYGYNENLNNKRAAYDLINSSFATYLKVEKTDRTKKEYYSCGGCQSNSTSETKFCPGNHLRYVWDEPYIAFVVKDVNPIKGVKEEIEMTSIKISNKYTKDNIGKGPIDSKGYVDIKKLNSISEIEQYTKMKAGYGFEVIISTKYETNLPERMSNVNRNNSANLKNSYWEKFSYFKGNNPLPLINTDRDNKLKPYLSNKNAVIFLNPSIDEIPISTLNQMFIKMPDSKGTIVNVKDKLDLTDGNGNTVPYSVSDKADYRETITNTTLTREKTFEFKKVNNFRKYYLSKETTNGKYSLKFVTAPSGIKLDCGEKAMIADKNDASINVSGGYQDDIKTHLNE